MSTHLTPPRPFGKRRKAPYRAVSRQGVRRDPLSGLAAAPLPSLSGRGWQPKTCQWPGQSPCGGKVITGKPYCAVHCSRAYRVGGAIHGTGGKMPPSWWRARDQKVTGEKGRK